MSVIQNCVSNLAVYLRTDTNAHAQQWKAAGLLCAAATAGFTALFRKKGFILVATLTIAALAKRVHALEQTNSSLISPFLRSIFSLSCRKPTLPQILLYEPHKFVVSIASLKNGKRQQELKRRWTEWDLTLLHIAVLAKNHFAVQYLVDQGGSLTARDVLDCTPIHLAFFTGDKAWVATFERIASERGVSTAPKNIYGATIAHLKKISAPPKFGDEDVVTHLRDQQGHIQPVSARRWKELTGINYCDYVETTPELLYKTWLSDVERTFSTDPNQFAAVQRCLDHPAKVYIASHPETGWGVYALEHVPSKCPLFLYAGEEVPPFSEGGSTYKMAHTDCKKNGNVASRINDGFPVVTAMGITGNGNKGTAAFFSIVPLAPGQMITFNYSYDHPCKFARYRLLNLELLENTNWTSVIQTIKRGLDVNEFPLKSLARRLEYCKITEPLCYLVDTPKAVIHLLYKQLISLTQLKDFKQFFSHNRALQSEPCKLILGFLNHAELIYKYLDICNDLKFTKIMNGIFESTFDRHHVVVGMKFLEKMGTKGLLPLIYEYYLANPTQFVTSLENYEKENALYAHFLDLAEKMNTPELREGAKREINMLLPLLNASKHEFIAMASYTLPSQSYQTLCDFLN